MERIYPAMPLETPINHEQQEHLLPPTAPPTYDQATTEPNVTPATTSGPAPLAPQQQTVVIIPPLSQPYGPTPQDIQCPFCHNYTRTRVRYKPTSRTHLIALILCLLQLYCCVCLPYCIGSCMNVSHYCGMCDHYLGTYVR